MSSVIIWFFFQLLFIIFFNLHFVIISKNAENIPPQVIKRVIKEISEITSEPLDGIKLISNEQDVSDIQAFLDGPGFLFFLNYSNQMS